MSSQADFDALRGSRLGTELSDAQARTLAGIVTFRDLAPGTILVQEGAADNHLYVIVSGVLGVIRPTRLNYARIIPMVDYTAKIISRLIS